MILQADYWTYIEGFFDWVANSGGIMVVISGIIAISWLGYERKRRGSFFKRKTDQEIEKPKHRMLTLLKIISFSGLIIGVLCVWAGVMGLILDIPPSFRYVDATENHANQFTCLYLIIIGIAMFFKPIKDLPLSSLFGILAGAVSTILFATLVPDTVIGPLISKYFKWICIAIFIIVACTVAVLFKFYIKVFVLISKVLSFPPVALGIAIFAFTQGILLWGFGVSIPNLIQTI